MDQIFILLALLLPTLLGRVWLGLFVPITIDGRAALTWGNGLLVGLLVIPILMRALNSVGVSISFPVVAAVAMFMIAVAWAVHIHHSGRVLSARSTASDFNLLSQGEKTLIAVLSRAHCPSYCNAWSGVTFETPNPMGRHHALGYEGTSVVRVQQDRAFCRQ